MTNEVESFEILKGRKVVDVETEVSVTSALENAGKDNVLIEIPLKISFDEYVLFIYNKWSFVSTSLKDIGDLKGKKIVGIKILSQILELMFNGSDCIKIDLTDDGYIGPEALVLYGPENLIIVWN
jgi:hypothetical protein